MSRRRAARARLGVQVTEVRVPEQAAVAERGEAARREDEGLRVTIESQEAALRGLRRSAAACPPSPTVPSTIQAPGDTGASQLTTSSTSTGAWTFRPSLSCRHTPCSDSLRVMSSKPPRRTW